jgi:hypothetical protein
MDTSPTRPALSIVIVSFSSPASLARCLESLVEQAIAHNAEILIVRARIDDADCLAVRRRFGGCRWLLFPVGETVPRLRCQGMAAARGLVVALIEDDCVVDARWCEAQLHAHREPWAAIGGAVEPDRYTRALDWAVYFYEYGRFMLPFDAHPSSVLPGNNVSYKREALAAEEADRTDGFYDVIVHDAWRRRGVPMLQTPTLLVTNRNSWPLSYASVEPFHHGRGFAARRMAGQPWARRGVRAVLTPILPLLQLYRIVRLLVRKRRFFGPLVCALPWLLVFGTSWAVGEGIGYVLGPGKSVQRWR